MVGGGPFGLKPGECTDDTSKALCLAEWALRRQVVRRHEPFRRFPVRRTQFADVLDYYMKQKEFRGDGAMAASEADVEETEAASIDAPNVLAATLKRWTQFYELAPNCYEDARQRVLYPKDVIENEGSRNSLFQWEANAREKELQLLFRFTWFGCLSGISREVNGGRGPVDFLTTSGVFDKIPVVYKLASNSILKQNLQN